MMRKSLPLPTNEKILANEVKIPAKACKGNMMKI